MQFESADETSTNSEPANSVGTDKVELERRSLEWIAMFNIALNEDLEKHYARIDVVIKVAVALFGTYSFVTLFVDAGCVYKMCGLLVAILSIVTLVVDFDAKRVSAKIQRNKYSEAFTDAKMATSVSELGRVRRCLCEIACDDLPTGEICDALAKNCAIDRLGLDATYKAKVNSFVRLTRYIFPWGKPKYGHR